MWGHGAQPDHSMMLGRLLERSEHMLGEVRELGTKVDHIGERVAALEKGKADIPRWETVIKRMVPWLISLLTLAGTGSVDAALRMVDAMAKLAAAVK